MFPSSAVWGLPFRRSPGGLAAPSVFALAASCCVPASRFLASDPLHPRDKVMGAGPPARGRTLQAVFPYISQIDHRCQEIPVRPAASTV